MKKKYFFIGMLILTFLFIIGAVFMFNNSLDSLIEYKHMEYSIEKNGEKFIFQNGYAFKRDNIPAQVCLSGTHYEMGLQYGVLLKDETREMVDCLHGLIIYYSKEMKLPKDIVWAYFKFKINKLSKNIPERFKEEIKGISEGCGADINAIYAISLFDDLLHSMGCTSIIALSEDGTIIHGRNEDLYFGMELGFKPVIVKYNPKGYNSFISISFPGFIGVSTGYNNNGLGYSHNSRYADKVNYKGYPQHSVPRQALEECSTLQEVIAFYEDKPIIIGDGHTWSDRNSSTGCIIETASDKNNHSRVIEMKDKVLYHINEYIDPDYINQAESKYKSEDGFNTARAEILTHLIKDDDIFSLDDIIALLREENGPSSENYNYSGITRGICNIDTQQMILFDPNGEGLYLARNYYYASKNTVYFIPTNFELTPYEYKNAEKIDPILEDIAIIKESMLTQSELINELKKLTEKYPNQGFIYFITGQTLFDSGSLDEWANYMQRAYDLPTCYDWQEVLLENAKVAFYKNDLKFTEQLLSQIKESELRSFSAKAELLYLYSMYYKELNNKNQSQRYKNKFTSFVNDKKIQKKIIKRLKPLKK